jgi:hypothetical protein
VGRGRALVGRAVLVQRGCVDCGCDEDGALICNTLNCCGFVGYISLNLTCGLNRGCVVSVTKLSLSSRTGAIVRVGVRIVGWSRSEKG